jgi:hypothetical protein
MKKKLETRLKNLEKQYGPKIEPQRVIGLRWITAEQWRRGVRPGVYRVPSGDKSSEPYSLIRYIRYVS